ncbi:hypothetical protein QAD02_022748 [Eretmocerus hayati]|uniref:Uncharacterized protein n=1 Tax=Eretmocerus hayati TaxID=131215 RepID=A0ACC2PUH7_9HYME|nr:hypothetical protein QAD02_022748 [Eretmocerus hayati]
MPGCAAIGCNNRSEKGFTMKSFPREPLIRAIWKHRVGRADWEPSNNSFLCHAHFEPNQRQVTQNGKVKLKRDAIPSVFTITSTRKSIRKRSKEQNDTINSNHSITETPFVVDEMNPGSAPFITEDSQKSANIGGLVLQCTNFLNVDALKNLKNENVIILARRTNQKSEDSLDTQRECLLEDEKMEANIQTSQHNDTLHSSQTVVEEKSTEYARDTENVIDIISKTEKLGQKLKVSPCIKNIENNLRMNIRLRREPCLKGAGSTTSAVKKKETQRTDSDLSQSEKLMTKVNLQAEVIEKLTNQLIMYKDMERRIKESDEDFLNQGDEVEILNQFMNGKECQSNEPVSHDSNNNGESDLRNKLNLLEEENKKLQEIITLEYQNRQKIECQMKNQTNVIKKLNLKLDKTLECLDEAEKNAQYYQQQMLTMQSLWEKQNLTWSNSVFDELFRNYIRKSFSENNLKRALEIEKECGIEGYQKLLDYQFPLPSLKELNDEFPNEVEYYEASAPEIVVEEEVEQGICRETNNFPRASIKSEIITNMNPDPENKSTPVIKTVQDLLDEISDDEDMDLSEFQKYIVLD